MKIAFLVPDNREVTHIDKGLRALDIATFGAMMRTTLDIEEDVLEVAKSLAKHRRLSLGKAVSDLIRKSIHPPMREQSENNGLRVISRKADAKPVTLEIVNKLGHYPAAMSPVAA